MRLSHHLHHHPPLPLPPSCRVLRHGGESSPRSRPRFLPTLSISPPIRSLSTRPPSPPLPPASRRNERERAREGFPSERDLALLPPRVSLSLFCLWLVFADTRSYSVPLSAPPPCVRGCRSQRDRRERPWTPVCVASEIGLRAGPGCRMDLGAAPFLIHAYLILDRGTVATCVARD